MKDENRINLCIVDDDTDFTEFLTQYFEMRGYSSSRFESAEDLLKSGSLDEYNFFILDLGLPGIDGVDLTTMIRGRSAAGILIVSGRMGPDAFNSALAAGADMFINKPVRFDQIYHAILSILRRTSHHQPNAEKWGIAANGTTLYAPSGQTISLSPLEGRLIEHLRAANGEAVSRADLAQAGELAASQDHRNLDAAIFRLRRKIERETGLPSPFRTVHGIGYQLSQDIMQR